MFADGRGHGRRFSPQLTAKKKLPSQSERELAPLIGTDLMKNPKCDLRAQYRRVLETSAVFSLVLALLGVNMSRRLQFANQYVADPNIKIEVADIPQTEQPKRRPPPPRPVLPIPSESEDIPDDLTIESTELMLAELPPPPPPNEDEEGITLFIPYDEPPEIIGGLRALLEALEYPKLAQKAGIEGTVIISVEVDEHGTTRRTRVLKGFDTRVGFEDAAIKALKKLKWKPALQRDKPIKVWINVPVRFQLT